VVARNNTISKKFPAGHQARLQTKRYLDHEEHEEHEGAVGVTDQTLRRYFFFMTFMVFMVSQTKNSASCPKTLPIILY
jgi:hypothetical protein